MLKHLQAHFDINPGATPQGAGQGHPAPHHFAQRAADHQAQARAFGVLHITLCLYEGPEQALLIACTDANTSVFDAEVYIEQAAIDQVARNTDFDRTLFCELDGVAEQIGEYLLETQGIDQHIAIDARVDVENQVQAFLPGQSFEHPGH
ncbi:hypothetical protein D3C81_1783190 [compost metagenome]